MTNPSSPAVSVVLPTYNRAPELEPALRSVLNQTYRDFDLLVVDDASTDDTQQILKPIDDARVRILVHEANRGASAARNTGIRAARGEFVAFLDSDDRWLPEKLERQMRTMEASPHAVGVVYCGTTLPDGPPRETPGIMPGPRGDIYERQLARDHIAGTPTWLVRRECFDRAGLFNEDLPARNDYEMSIRLAEHCEFDYVDEALVEVGTSADDRLTEDVERRLEAHERIIHEVVEPRLDRFGEWKRRRILATQYFTGGRYAQRRGCHAEARRWLKKSLGYQSLSVKTLVSLLLAWTNRDLPSFYYRWAYRDR